MTDTTALDHIEIAAGIVSAYVSNNSVPSSELPALISSVYSALDQVGGRRVEEPVEAPVPAVPIKKSIAPDYIVCLEDGKKFKSLKRHLRTKYDLSPEQYRARWGLPSDYPMVAPSYAAARSELAKSMGLGAQRRRPEIVAPAPKAPAPKASAAPKASTASAPKAAAKGRRVRASA